MELQADQERRLRRIGVEPETRKYMPHVTLARLRGVAQKAVADYLASRGALAADAFTAERFVLYSARDGSGGGPYIVEAAFPLGSGRAMISAIDAARRRVRLDPRDPDFFAIPIRAYAAIREAAPVFFWEDYGFWCFAAPCRRIRASARRRFGRQILHVMSRAELGWPDPKPHLEPFDALERHSILESSRPGTRGCRGLVNRAFVSRRIEKLGPQIAALAHERIDALRGPVRPSSSPSSPAPFRSPSSPTSSALRATWGRELVDWSHRMVAMYQFGVDRAVEDRAAEAARAFATSCAALPAPGAAILATISSASSSSPKATAQASARTS